MKKKTVIILCFITLLVFAFTHVWVFGILGPEAKMCDLDDYSVVNTENTSDIFSEIENKPHSNCDSEYRHMLIWYIFAFVFSLFLWGLAFGISSLSKGETSSGNNKKLT